jgi:hypothetical protein
MSKGKRWVLRICAAITLLPIVALLCLYVSSWVNQKKAERMFAHVSALRVGESTFDEVQALWKEYGSQPGFAGQKCDRSDCTFEIATWNFVSEHKLDWKFMRALGIKPNLASSNLTVKDGKLSYAEFDALYESEAGAWVYARVDSSISFSREFLCSYISLQLHPTYVVSLAHRSGSIYGAQIEVSLTPGAPDLGRALASEIHWKCMTAIFACEGLSSDMTKGLQAFMPAAYAEFIRDQDWETHQSLWDYPQLLRECQTETRQPLPTSK